MTEVNSNTGRLLQSRDLEEFSFEQLSPAIDRVPVEIWQRIFMVLASSEDVAGLGKAFSPVRSSAFVPTSSRHNRLIIPQTPSLVSQVCFVWRSYAFGMPHLWNAFLVQAPTRTQVSALEGLGRLIDMRIGLSRSLPLEISIKSENDEEAARTLIRTFIPLASRLRSIHLRIPFDTVSELFVLCPGDLPHLTSLEMHIPMDGRGAAGITQIRLFHSIPSIRRLRTSYLPPDSCKVYAVLEELHIEESRSETWSTLAALSACRNLRVLTLSGVGITMENTNTSNYLPQIVLSELHTLNMEHPEGRERFLEAIILPNLKTLTIGGSCSGDSAPFILQSVSLMMDRSNITSLESLSFSLADHTIDPATFVSFLLRNDGLKELWIDDRWKSSDSQPLITDDLLRALTPRSIDGRTMRNACPKLDFLSLVGWSDFEDEALIALLKSRCQLERFASNQGEGFMQNTAKASPDYPGGRRIREVHISTRRETGRNNSGGLDDYDQRDI